MCTAFSALQALSARRRDPQEVRRQLVEAEVHLGSVASCTSFRSNVATTSCKSIRRVRRHGGA
eukprot:5279416-Heterocapsa_arctica.AAC.1